MYRRLLIRRYDESFVVGVEGTGVFDVFRIAFVSQ